MLVAAAVAAGCGGASRTIDGFECIEGDGLSYAPACSAPTLDLAVEDSDSVQVVRAEFAVDAAPTKQGVHVVGEGEHVLAVELEVASNIASRAGAVVAAERRFSVAAGCRLRMEVAVQPSVGELPAAVSFHEVLRCENALHAEASIPQPRDLAEIPSPIAMPALERWGEQCVDDARAADRYVGLAVDATLDVQDIVVFHCLAEKLDRISSLREGIEASSGFTASSPDELSRDARLVRSVCLRVLDLQAEAKQCI